MTERPLLALTIGDPAGIGPEIALRLLAGPRHPARLLLVGDRHALERDAALAGGVALPPCVDGPEDAVLAEDGGDGLIAGLWEPRPRWAPDDVPAHGVVSPRAGAASRAWVTAAAELALAGRVAGIVTGPIHKEAWRLAGAEGAGHTELLREIAGVEHVLMMLVGGRLRAALATIHVPLADVPGLLDAAGIERDLVMLAQETARWFGPARPRIAVAGLNPHAGDGGLFGREEEEIVGPAVAAARRRGIDAHGPLPADACLPAATTGAWDAVLAMYHDQALPTVKAVALRRAVNVTLGLPFVRTSVDHGTAFDVAGRGIATPSSLEAAVEVAVAMAGRRSALNADRPRTDLP